MELAACVFESGFDLPGEMLEKAKLLFLGIFLTPLRHIWDFCHISCNFVISIKIYISNESSLRSQI